MRPHRAIVRLFPKLLIAIICGVSKNPNASDLREVIELIVGIADLARCFDFNPSIFVKRVDRIAVWKATLVFVSVCPEDSPLFQLEHIDHVILDLSLRLSTSFELQRWNTQSSISHIVRII